MYICCIIFLISPVLTELAADTYPIADPEDVSVMSYPQQSFEERVHITQCLELHNVILYYLKKSKIGKRQSDWEDRLDENINTMLNAIKADSYMKVYMEACKEGTEQLLIDIVNMEEQAWKLRE